MSISLQEFENALGALNEALQAPKSDLTRDATIQRFEFCVELAWKSAKKLLGTTSTAPRVVIREMGEQAIITDLTKWFEFLEARNLSSHTYKEDLAEKVYQVAQSFLPEGLRLLEKLRTL